MKYWMQPEVTNDNMKAALGRWVPANAQVVKTDPFWLQNTDPHVIPYVKEIMGPTIPFYEGYTPAWGQVNSEQLWGSAHADVIKNGMKASDAIDKAFKRAERNLLKLHDGINVSGGRASATWYRPCRATPAGACQLLLRSPDRDHHSSADSCCIAGSSLIRMSVTRNVGYIRSSRFTASMAAL